MLPKYTTVTPASYAISNFGTEVQAVTFKYGDKVFTINRAGKRNIVAYHSQVNGTTTFRCGGVEFKHLLDSKTTALTIHYVNGTSLDVSPE